MRLYQQFGLIAALITAFCFANARSSAVLVEWDPDGNLVSDGGNGTWDVATTANWNNGGFAATWTNGDDATFGDSGGNYTVDIADGGVTVGNLSYAGTNKLQLKSVTDNLGVVTIKAGGATWNTGGGEIEFLNDTSNDTPLNLAGQTLTVNGGGVFDTGERGNGANWGAGNLVFTEATTLRGAAFSVGQLSSVAMAGGSSFIMERNSNQDINNDWVLDGDVTFDNRFNTRTIWANGEFSGAGRLTVQGLGTNANSAAGFLRLNNTSNSWSGGLTVDGSINSTVVSIAGGDAALGAVPVAFDADNIILSNGGALKLFAFALNANRGVTLAGSGGTLISANGVNTINGAITGEGSLQIGRASDGSQNVILLNSNASDYQGSTNVVRGTLRLGVNNATPSGSVLVIGGAVGGNVSRFDMNGFNTTVAGLTQVGSNTREVQNSGGSASTLIVDVAAGESYTFGANFTGSSAVNIVKEGLGTQALNRGTGYSAPLGDVTVNNGELVWDSPATGTIMTGAMNVGVNGTLSGSGVVEGAATVAGELAPGSSAGTLTFENNLALQAAAVLSYELAGDDTTVGSGVNDLIAVIGDLTLGGELNVSEFTVGSFLSAVDGDSWALLTYTGALIDNGLDLGALPALSPGLEYSIDTTIGGQVNLLVSSVVAVPEPSAFLMVGLVAMAYSSAKRRRGVARS